MRWTGHVETVTAGTLANIVKTQKHGRRGRSQLRRGTHEGIHGQMWEDMGWREAAN